MRLLHLTKVGDRATKLFLLEKWGEIGQDAAKHAERVCRARSGVYANRPKFPGLLAEGLYQGALSPDREIAYTSARSMLIWVGSSTRHLDRSTDWCGVVGGGSVLPGKVHTRLQQLLTSHWPMLRAMLSDVDLRVFDGLAFYASQHAPELISQEAARRYWAAGTEEDRARAGYWCLYSGEPPDSRIIRAMNKEWRSDPPRWFWSYLKSPEGEKFLGKFTEPPKEGLTGPYAHLVERAKTGQAAFRGRVISEAKTVDDFRLAMAQLGDRVLRDGNGQEAEGLWKFWPESRSHVQRMLSSERFVSRYVACYVLAQIPKEKFQPGEWAGYLDKMAQDPDAFINHGIISQYCDGNDEDVQDVLISVLRKGRDPQLILKILDRVYDERPANRLVQACAQSNHPQIREYAQEILKQRYR